MKNPILSIYIALLLGGLSACDNRLVLPETSGEPDEGTMSFAVNYTVAPCDGAEGTPEGTRSSPDDVQEEKVQNVWVFQFDGTADNSLLLTSPRYMQTKPDGSLLVGAIPSTTPQRILFIANTNLSSINWNATKGVTTYRQIIEVAGQRTREDEHYGQSNRNLLLNGVYDGTIVLNQPLTPVLRRAMAKISLSLTLAPDYGFEVTSVRLCNLPSKIVWAEDLHTHSENDITPTPLETTFLSCAPDVRTIQKGASDNYQWYVPSNRKGTSSATTTKEKNRFAPGGATYVEITAINPDDRTKGRIYRIYPGSNLINNYNIQSNRHYKLNLTLTPTTEADDRIEIVANKVFDELSNCYILNPPPIGSAPIVFSIPVVDRTNQFYNGDYKSIDRSGFYGFTTASSEWECRVIWSDNPNLVYNDYSSVSPEQCLSFPVAVGDGVNQKRLHVQLPPLTKDQQGSILVGIYEKGRNKCRWSWHLWVTDYNPNVPVTVKYNQFTYNVPEGQVVRLGTNVFGYRKKDLNPPDGSCVAVSPDNAYYFVNKTSKDSPYTNEYLMDRNVGARSAYGRKEENSGFYYQFGRKDPFSFWRKLYHYNGNPAATFTPYNDSGSNLTNSMEGYDGTQYRLTMSDAIEFPTHYFSSKNSYSSYLGTTSGGATAYDSETTIRYHWHDLKIAYSAQQGGYSNDIIRKSIFDPCPEGWQVMCGFEFPGDRPIDVELSSPNNVPYSSTEHHPRGLKYMGAQGDGLYYWPAIRESKQGPYPVNGVIYFPETGTIDNVGAIIYTDDMPSILWLATREESYSPQKGHRIYFSKREPLVSEWTISNVKATGCPVRCVKNPKPLP